jgi:hypothetical protein
MTLLDCMDCVKGAETAGNRGFYLKGAMVQLCLGLSLYGFEFFLFPIFFKSFIFSFSFISFSLLIIDGFDFSFKVIPLFSISPLKLTCFFSGIVIVVCTQFCVYFLEIYPKKFKIN